MSAKYVIGIDLGTTNSVLAYAPLEAEEPAVELLPIPQLVSPSTVEPRTSLPSFLYLATDAEAEAGTCDVPWEDGRAYAVGEVARARSAEVPDRTVVGAKSWLCHGRVDRHAPILPWGAPDSIARVSPVTATCRYLEHVVATWTAAFPDAPVGEQQVVLTVPASFDASARELTREAASAAGLPDDFLLLEEPQAAIHAWLDDRGDRWRKLLNTGDTLLVVDLGGGTTDLTLVRVGEEEGELVLERIAVGNHLLVGGDNMDLALAHHVAGLFAKKGTNLDPWQSISLWHSCRAAKETLLADGGPESHPISVLGRGSKLVGGTITIDVARKATAKLLLDGFFPKCELGERPTRHVASGFQEIGLPFESDTGITRHVAAFLADHGEESEPVRPTHVLFNGGVFKAGAFAKRLMDVLGGWFPEAKPVVLEAEGESADSTGGHDLDHAVSRGAAVYGWTKSHGGVRIRGGTARSYYVGIETAGLAVPGAPRPLRALCVVPRGMEEGTEAEVPSGEFGLVVGEPARFRFFSSPVRRDDVPGDLLPGIDPEELVETAPLEATLTAEDTDERHVPVRFESRITELGMFELWCVSTRSGERWKLEFSVREDE